MKIRFAELQDFDTIAFFNQAMAMETEQMKIENSVAIDGVRNLINQPQYGFYVVAEIETKIVGSLLITYEWSDWRNDLIWWIQSVYVKPEYRKMKVFKTLLNFIEEEAQLKNVSCVRLYMEKENRNAHQTYEHCGFNETHYRVFEKLILRNNR